MEQLSLYSTVSPSPTSFLSPLSITQLTSSRTRTLSFNLRRPRKFAIVASQDDHRNNLSEADLMEFKFGQMLGEDPKLTIAKIMGKKLNPDASYLEIEKNFYKNNGKMVEVKEVPFDVPKRRGSLNEKNELNLARPVPKPGIKVGGVDDSKSELNLVRPVPKSGIKVGGMDDSKSESNLLRPVSKLGMQVGGMDDSKNELNLLRPVPKSGIRVGGMDDSKNALNLVRPGPKSGIKVGSMDDSSSEETKPRGTKVSTSKSNVPNIILRKPSVYDETDDPMAESLKLRIKPNLSLKMRTDQVKEKFGGMTLLKRPEPIYHNPDADGNPDSYADDVGKCSGVEEISLPKNDAGPSNVLYVSVSNQMEGEKLLGSMEPEMHESSSKLPILEKPKPFVEKIAKISSAENESPQSLSTTKKIFEGSELGMQPHKPTDVEPSVNINEESSPPAKEPLSSSVSAEVALKGKPQRLDHSIKLTSNRSKMDDLANRESLMDEVEWMNFSQITNLEEHEGSDWDRAEKLSKIGYRVEVELISCSNKGYAVSFGSLIGFLPYRNLTDRFKFFAFPSWLRKKGLDPTKYRQNMGIVRSYEFLSNNSHLKSSNSENHQSSVVEIAADMEVEDLLSIYDQEKIRFLSSFVGQRIKVYVSLANKKSRRLTFSLKPKEKVEMVEKKRNLMARLSIGDVVKCSITKITFFGIFVEVEGVPALIHQSEVSWDSSVNPALDFKIGQVLEAKVVELDYPLERISLSLKDITPDPMSEALECVVGDANTLPARFESSKTDDEWAEVDSLIKELELVDGVESVSKGRFFLSPALAPTFQVYMASVFESQYKLLARAGNKGQEVIVEASLGKEEMKTAILTCTNRVA